MNHPLKGRYVTTGVYPVHGSRKIEAAIRTVEDTGWRPVAHAIVINPDYAVTLREPNLKKFYAKKRGLTKAKIDEELRVE